MDSGTTTSMMTTTSPLVFNLSGRHDGTESSQLRYRDGDRDRDMAIYGERARRRRTIVVVGLKTKENHTHTHTQTAGYIALYRYLHLRFFSRLRRWASRD